MAKSLKDRDANPGFVVRSKVFLQDVKSEMDKVTWPTREDLKASTTVVLLFLVLFAFMIGVLDFVFLNVVSIMFRLT
jgi:preprotein translocase subunit SecE